MKEALFDPTGSEYKFTEDLPENIQDKFTNAESGGFVQNRAIETESEAGQMAELKAVFASKYGNGENESTDSAMDVMHAEANELNDYRTEVLKQVADGKEFTSHEKKDILRKFDFDDEDIILALKGYGTWMSERLQNSEEFVIKFLKDQPREISSFPQYQDNKHVMMEVVAAEPDMLRYASKKLRDDTELVLTAIKNEEGSNEIWSVANDASDRIKKQLGLTE